MEEKKKKKVELPIIKDETDGEIRELKVASIVSSKHKGRRKCWLLKTEADTYALCMSRKVDGRKDIYQELYMSKDGFALFVITVLEFLRSDKVNLEKFFEGSAGDDFQLGYIKDGDEIEEGEE